MARILVPRAMVIIGHQIDKVQVLGDLFGLVAGNDLGLPYGDGGCEQETWPIGQDGIVLELDAKVLDQLGKAGLVSFFWKLPVQIEAVELVLSEASDCVPDEFLSLFGGGVVGLDEGSEFLDARTGAAK